MKFNKLIICIFFFSLHALTEDVLDESVYWELTRVDVKIEEKKFDEAEKILSKLYNKNWRSRSYNKAVIARTFGFFLYQQERFDEAILKLQVSFDEKALPLTESTSLVQALAQLYATQKNIEKAKKLLLDFIDTAESSPKPVQGMHNVYALTALIYATEKSFDLAYKYINTAISLSSSFREDWYQLKFAIEYNKNDFISAEESAKELLLNKPDTKRYYIQLSAIYNILEKYDLSLATMEVSYMKGMLEKPEEFTNLASFYLYRKNPAMSAKVLENAISAENILFTRANARLLSDSWLYAKERSRSLDVLDSALNKSPDDKKLAKQYVDIAFSAFKWKEVVEGIYRIRRLDIKDDGKYQLMLGIAYFELKQINNAKNAFIDASNSEKFKDSGIAWLEYVKALEGSF
jgi:predicted Zn-dependent protease